MRDNKKNTSYIFEILTDSFSKFFVLDVLFTILPLVVYIIVSLLIGESLKGLLTGSELAFVTIFFFGLSLTHFIELKTLYQGDISGKLNLGTRFYIFLLVLSVINLSFTILSKHGTIINLEWLSMFQIYLFILGFTLLFMPHLFKEISISQKYYLPKGINRPKYYQFIKESLEEVESDLNYVKFAIAKKDKLFNKIDDPGDRKFIFEASKERDIADLIVKIEQSVEEIKTIAIEKSAKEI